MTSHRQRTVIPGDGSPSGDEKGTRCDAAAAPATVSGEFGTRKPLDMVREGGVERSSREPGDLPSAMVTCERAGRGAPVGKSGCELAGALMFGVTCKS